MFGWNLNPRTPALDQLAGLANAELALVRVDAAERDQHVGVRGCGVEHLVVSDPTAPHPGLVVDGEDHRQHVALAVVVGDLLRGRLRRMPTEVPRGRREHLERDGILRLVGQPFGVRVHVDRDDLVEIDRH